MDYVFDEDSEDSKEKNGEGICEYHDHDAFYSSMIAMPYK